MRLEINAGGLDSFFNGVRSFVSAGINSTNSNHLINSIQNIINKTNNLSGGVGTLSLGLGYVQTRKTAEESRKIAVDNVKSEADSFIQTALRIDKAVATTLNGSREEFYKTNPWLRPPTPPRDWDRFWGGVGDTVSKCWKGIKDFFGSNVVKKILGFMTVAGAVALVTRIFLTGGLALAPLLAAYGLSARLSIGISLVVGAGAIASKAATFISSGLDLAAIVKSIVAPVYELFQKGMNTVSNLFNDGKNLANAGISNAVGFIEKLKDGIGGNFIAFTGTIGALALGLSGLIGLLGNSKSDPKSENKKTESKGNSDNVETKEEGLLTYNPDGNVKVTNKSKEVVPKVTNNVGKRSSAAYNEVVNQFEVADNPRYDNSDGRTWCNIYAWDVTSAMGCEIPHYVNNATGAPMTQQEALSNPGTYSEQNCGRHCDWLAEHGTKYGWREVSAEQAIQSAASGEPAVAITRGHIAMVAPNNAGEEGVYISQAGASNKNHIPIRNGFGSQTNDVKYYAHN